MTNDDSKIMGTVAHDGQTLIKNIDYQREADELERLKQLYNEKNRLLASLYKEVPQYDFYRALFPIGSFERKGCQEDGKPNGLALDIRGKGKAFHRIITDELDELSGLDREFVIMSPISYFGERRSGTNARFLYALAFDLDGVEMGNLKDVIHQMDTGILPKAAYIVNSGTGLHLYYSFEKPIPLYPNVQNKLKTLKYALIDRIWNKYTSTQKEPQRQGIFQGFRVVGSQSKLGGDFPVIAFECGDAVALEYLNGFVSAEKRVTDLKYKSCITLEEAKIKYPEWYDRRIERGEHRGRWNIKRDLYDWWKRRILSEIGVGHRFYSVFALAVYAKKCNVPEDELRTDAYEVMEYLDSLSVDTRNRFTEDDIIAALEVYNESYVTFPRDDISKLTAVPMAANKRNYQPQKDHLEEARAIRDIRMKRQGRDWREGNGRPSARQRVEDYINTHPEERICDIIRALGVSRNTVKKYYNRSNAKETSE